MQAEARRASIKRHTSETRIELSLELDGSGVSDVATGIGMLDHMLTLFAHHGLFDLSARCDGDLEIDEHHSAVYVQGHRTTGGPLSRSATLRSPTPAEHPISVNMMNLR